jgi:uncharacterized repeat protein (TIGR01451 family)
LVSRRKWRVWLFSGLLALLSATPVAAEVLGECRLSDPNSLGEHTDELCWLQFGSAGQTLADGYNDDYLFTLPDGSTLRLHMAVSNGGTLQVSEAPTWTGSNFSGDSNFYRLLTPNAAALYTEANGSANGTVVTLSNIRLFNPAGAEVIEPYEVVVADAERLNSNPLPGFSRGERLDFGVVSGGAAWQLVEFLGDAPSSAVTRHALPEDGGPPSICEQGSVDCIRFRGETRSDANAVVLSTRKDVGSSQPFTVTGQIHSQASQGFAYGLRWGGARLRKRLPAGRLAPADQFVYRIENVVGASVASRTTSGSASGDYPYISGQVMPGNTLALIEEMAAGSRSTLAQYDRSIACSNSNPGSTTALPSGTYDPANPPILELQLADAVDCTISNVPRLVDLTLGKTAPASARAGQALAYSLRIGNSGSHDATNVEFTDRLPAGITGVSPAGVKCAGASGGAVCGSLGVVVSGDAASGFVVSGRIQSLPGTASAGAAGSSVTVTLQVSAPATAGRITNTATVALADEDVTVGEPDSLKGNNSGSATVEVSEPTIDAADDRFTPTRGETRAGNAFDNDRLNSQALDPNDVVATLVDDLPPELTFDPATGEVGVRADSTPGTYDFRYRLCERADAGNCDEASVTVVVTTLDITAGDDSFVTGSGGAGDPALGNLFDNDSLNGSVADPTTVSLTLTGTPPAQLLVDTQTGSIGIAPGTPAGDYSVDYQICERLVPDNCTSATISVRVAPPTIDALDDDYSASVVQALSGGTLGKVLGNDSLNGTALALGTVTLEQVASSSPDVSLDPASGAIRVAASAAAGSYTLDYRICDVLNPGICDTARVTLAVAGDSPLRLSKQASPQRVKVGDLIRYTLVAENTGGTNLTNISLVDNPPAGFSYVDGSLAVSDRDGVAHLAGLDPLRVDGVSVAAGGRLTISYFLRVGAGAAARGEYVNSARLMLAGNVLSNVAQAAVQRVSDPLFEDSRVLGSVFLDRDGDGWQDSAKATGLSVRGGFAADVYVPGSTVIDRGDGPRPEPDASAPLLHGLALGDLMGRRSPDQPAGSGRISISQRLRAPVFTDDFELRSAEGTLVRMRADGSVALAQRGDVARGLASQDLRVTRQVAVVDDGQYWVTYEIVNVGVDEPGLPGVRLGTVEGLLVETDSRGRFHLEGLDVEHIGRGRNFIMKVDAATLPAGSRFVDGNPKVKRITQGMPVRFDFAVQAPEQPWQAPERVELELGEVLFAPGSAEIRPEYAAAIETMVGILGEHQGGAVDVVGHAEQQPLALRRAEALRDALLARVTPAAREHLSVRLRPETHSLLRLSGQQVRLGEVLFETDKTEVRPQYRPLLDELARQLQARQASGAQSRVVIAGHADRRGSQAYNQALGLRRAKAVFAALAERMSPQARARLRVEVDDASLDPSREGAL